MPEQKPIDHTLFEHCFRKTLPIALLHDEQETRVARNIVQELYQYTFSFKQQSPRSSQQQHAVCAIPRPIPPPVKPERIMGSYSDYLRNNYAILRLLAMAIRRDAHVHPGRPYSKLSWNATLPWSQPLVPWIAASFQGHRSIKSHPASIALGPPSHSSLPIGVFYCVLHDSCIVLAIFTDFRYHL